jgi:hypothetical protein
VRLVQSVCGYIQMVESTDLEAKTQESNPAKYHDAWRALVGAGYVSFGRFSQQSLTRGYVGASSYPVASVREVQKA